MFIKNLKIESVDGIIRDMSFHPGLNLIVDETPELQTETGNNVGKTTVLRLIDICLGKEPRSIYVSPEDRRTVNEQLKQFLIEKEVVITLTMVSAWTTDAREVVIRRNFLTYGKALREVNGKPISDSDYIHVLQQSIMDTYTEKPTFRQLIGHNIRYSNVAVQQTLRYLEGAVNDTVYESLYLYMLGCDFQGASQREQTMDQLMTEKLFKTRLERGKNKNMLASELGILRSEIKELEQQKSHLHLNPDFETDMKLLTDLKFEITTLSSQLSNLQLRRSIINEARQDLLNQRSNMDTEELRQIYVQAGKYMPELHHSFEDLLSYHNSMLVHKAEFVSSELPILDGQIDEISRDVESLVLQEHQISEKLFQTVSYADYEQLVSSLTQKYERLGALEQQINQIEEVDAEIARLDTILSDIDKDLFDDAFQFLILSQQEIKFNSYFARISRQLYGEQYAMIYNVVRNKKIGKNIYKFTIEPIDTDTVNFSTGKKQGEITCFDMAYILFADEENIPCLHFGLYDKKELMHDHQLIETAQFVANHPNLQFVASILRDKLPAELNDEKYFVVKLSPEEKLFKF